jgi:hypothetical protein
MDSVCRRPEFSLEQIFLIAGKTKDTPMPHPRYIEFLLIETQEQFLMAVCAAVLGLLAGFGFGTVLERIEDAMQSRVNND